MVLFQSSICLILVIFGSIAFGNEDTIYTTEEKEALEQFRELVADLLYLDYQKEDTFLIPWIRRAELDLAKAKGLLEKALKWRKENGIDGILHEELMINMEKAFPHTLDGVDKHGRPILTLQFLSWDIRKINVAGKGKDLTRYLDYLMEKCETKIRSLSNSTHTVTQIILIVDMNGFSLRQHACARCTSFYVDLFQHYSNYYPHKLKYAVLINTNRVFERVLQILSRVVPPITQEEQNFLIYGLDKAEWSPFLLSIISADQLPTTFGGTAEHNKV